MPGKCQSGSDSHRVQLRDAFLVPAAFERRFKPDAHNFQCEIFRDHPLANGKNIRVVVLAREAGSLLVPAKRATYKVNLFRGPCFPGARSAKDITPVAFAARTPLPRRAKE